jgi:hypothetical protein
LLAGPTDGKHPFHTCPTLTQKREASNNPHQISKYTSKKAPTAVSEHPTKRTQARGRHLQQVNDQRLTTFNSPFAKN